MVENLLRCLPFPSDRRLLLLVPCVVFLTSVRLEFKLVELVELPPNVKQIWLYWVLEL